MIRERRDDVSTDVVKRQCQTKLAGPAPSQVGKVSEMGTIERILTFNGLMSKYPWTFGVGIATAKTGAADILFKNKSRREKLDWQRVGLFTLFDLHI